jgi:hypothetical protein
MGARRPVAAGKFTPQPGVVALELGHLLVQVVFGGARPLAAGSSRLCRPCRQHHQQANNKTERGCHRQQQALADAVDWVVEDRDVVDAGVLQDQIAHHHTPDGRQE